MVTHCGKRSDGQVCRAEADNDEGVLPNSDKMITDGLWEEVQFSEEPKEKAQEKHSP